MKFYVSLVICFSLISLKTFGQTVLPENSAVAVQQLRDHMRFLSDDRLEGRRVGSKGEKKAKKYIIKQFKANGVKAIGKSYEQKFSFSRLKYTPNTRLEYRKEFHPGSTTIYHPIAYQRFYPLHFSGLGRVTAPVTYVGYGIDAGDTYNDYKYVGSVKDRIVIINLGFPEKDTPEKFARFSDIEAKADTAISKGATAIIFLNNDSTNDFPKYKPYFTQGSFKTRKQVPIVFFPNAEMLENLSLYEVTIHVDTVTEVITGTNIVGLINNNAKNTVVLGAHYDHLGYNELGGSTFQTNHIEYPRIHNGADDNASGTSALLSLSYLLSKSSFTNNNYLLAAFSGEEEGLLGSNFLANHFPLDTASLNYMINLDMVGRLDSIRGTFSISGVGTSSAWQRTLDAISVDGLKVKYESAGQGSSDHTSFYNIGVPALHYFTGTHYDYHKPSDDEWKINYIGMLSIMKHIYELVGKLDAESPLDFTPTSNPHSGQSSFKVTLGIMPDYLYESKGVKVDGVTPGKPASMGGVLRGDVIIGMGDYTIESIQDYMKALSSFSKGQQTKVRVIRAGQQQELSLQF